VQKVLKQDLQAAAPLRQTRPREGVINVGNAGPGGLELYDFVPRPGRPRWDSRVT
jgi:hypothetical protein